MSDPKQEMRAELEDALGEKVDDETADRALAGPRRSRFAAIISENELLLAITAVGAIVVGVILSLALNSWVFVVIAVLVHGIGTIAVTTLSILLASSDEKPDPRTVARLEEEGVADPELSLNDAVSEARGGTRGVRRAAE